jgi:hypothetical protein
MPRKQRAPARTQARAAKAPKRPPASTARDPSKAFADAAAAALRRGNLDAISDNDLRKVLTAAVKLYAAKAERHGEIAPFAGGAVTATETVVAACAMIRAADLNLFDVAMWFHRPLDASRQPQSRGQ